MHILCLRPPVRINVKKQTIKYIYVFFVSYNAIYSTTMMYIVMFIYQYFKKYNFLLTVFECRQFK